MNAFDVVSRALRAAVGSLSKARGLIVAARITRAAGRSGRFLFAPRLCCSWVPSLRAIFPFGGPPRQIQRQRFAQQESL